MIESRETSFFDSSPTSEQIEHWLKSEPCPRVDRSVVTFVFRGKADGVELKHWIYGLPSSITLSQVPHSDLWYRAMEFPHGSRIEYKFGLIRDGHEKWICDPLNPNIAHDPFGGNSVVHCEGYAVPAWSQPDSNVAKGSIKQLRIKSDVFHDQRTLRVYLPANFRDYRRYRLLIVHDGEDYLRYSKLDNVLDNLIGNLEIPPMIVAMTSPHDRLREYADDPRHAEHVVREIIPMLESKFPLIKEPSGRCAMGASFGAVASLSTAWRFPDTFASLLLQSGSFAFTDIGEQVRGPVFDPVARFMNTFRKDPGQAVQSIFLSCGVYESLIYENRSMVPFLQSAGIDVKMVESRDGHNWENWRDRLRDGLTWLFPGPLWVTYL